jgi:hypothetical protein
MICVYKKLKEEEIMRRILSVLVALTMLCSLIVPAATVMATDNDKYVGTNTVIVEGRKNGDQYEVSYYLYSAQKCTYVDIGLFSDGGIDIEYTEAGKPVYSYTYDKTIDISPMLNQCWIGDGSNAICAYYGGDSSDPYAEDGPIFNGEKVCTFYYNITGEKDELTFTIRDDKPLEYTGVWDEEMYDFPVYTVNVVYDLDPLVDAETTAPATEAPETQAPATEAPATEAPATEAPATEAPATEAPATEAPATEAPATEAPATEAPTPDTPTYDEHTLVANGEIVGDQYVITTYLYNNPGLAGFELSLSYNTKALAIKSVTNGEIFPDDQLVDGKYTDEVDGETVPHSPFIILVLDDTIDAEGNAINFYHDDGLLVTYVFDILDTDEDPAITLTPVEGWWCTDPDFEIDDIPNMVTDFKWVEDAADTTAPATETEAPATETEAPATETEAPATETEAPATETEAPATETEAPATETEAPATETEAPATETEAPATEAPAPEVPSFENMTVYVEGTTQDNTLTLTATLYNNPGLSGFALSMDYDPAVVKLVSVTEGNEVFPVDLYMTSLIGENPTIPFVAMALDDTIDKQGNATNFYYDDGVLMTYTFEILDPDGDPAFDFVPVDGWWVYGPDWEIEYTPDVVQNIPFGSAADTTAPVTETEAPATETEAPATEAPTPEVPTFEDLTVYVTGETQDDTLVVTASLYNNPGLGCFGLTMSYDPDVVKLISVTPSSDVFPADLFVMSNLGEDPTIPFYVLASDETIDAEGNAINFYTEDGVLITYTFQILDPDGDPAISFAPMDGWWLNGSDWENEFTPDIVVNLNPDNGTETEPPVTETEAPATETEAPATETEAPATETEAPATETEAPATETEAPATETEAPATETEAPATETEAPVTETQAPTPEVPEVTDTQAPDETETGAPESGTAAAPVDSTTDTTAPATTGSTSNKNDAPQTGDKIMLIVIVMAVAVASCGVVVVIRRKISSK